LALLVPSALGELRSLRGQAATGGQTATGPAEANPAHRTPTEGATSEDTASPHPPEAGAPDSGKKLSPCLDNQSRLAGWVRAVSRIQTQCGAANRELPAEHDVAGVVEDYRLRLERAVPAAQINEATEARLLHAAREELDGAADDLDAADSDVPPSRALDPRVAAVVRQRLLSTEVEVARLTSKIVHDNQGLVTFVVKRYQGLGLSLSDLTQEGNIGLLRAVKKFDPNRGIRFNTYAVWWIRQAAQRALADQSRTIRIPVHVLEDRRALLRTSQRLDNEGRPHSIAELREQTGFSAHKVSHLLDLAKEPLSLDAPKGPDDDARLIDFISDSHAVDPTNKMIEAERAKQLAELLKDLTERERHMLRMRFGIGTDECTLEQVGHAFGVTRERARQIVEGAVDKMRRAACRKRLS
jgi:RNA polymerase sigma factor (sigma-70 family)